MVYELTPKKEEKIIKIFNPDWNGNKNIQLAKYIPELNDHDNGEKVVFLNQVKEWKNICKKCGAENTLYPYDIGRKCLHKCEACNQFSTGITKKEWDIKHGN